MNPDIYFYNQILDIAGRTAIVMIIAFVISHLVIKNNFNIVKPNLIEKFLLSLTLSLIYTITLLFNFGEKRLLIFDLALPIIIVAGILGGIRVSVAVSALAAVELNFLFPLSWPYAVLTILAGVISGFMSHIQQTNQQKMMAAGVLQFIFSSLQVALVYFFFEGFLYRDMWQNIFSVVIVIMVQVASVFIFLYIIYSIIDYQQQQQMLYLQNQARLRLLESQINPHFLFNSLNTIGSLTRTDPPRAHQLILELSSLLRSSLRKQGELIPLVDEIKNIESYLEIALARFGQRIVIDKNLPDIYFKYKVPNLIWEPIVENAIIHNIKQQETVKLHLSIRKDQNILSLVTYDNGSGIESDKLQKILNGKNATGLGLSSTIERLENFYHQKNLLNINSSPKGTIVTVKIPLQQSIT